MIAHGIIFAVHGFKILEYQLVSNDMPFYQIIWHTLAIGKVTILLQCDFRGYLCSRFLHTYILNVYIQKIIQNRLCYDNLLEY